MTKKNYIESSFCQEDIAFEVPLRPQSLQDFEGQESICERLEILMGAAKARKEQLGHCLFCGPPGLGKTTLANILAKSMGTRLVVTSGPVIEKAGDLAGILTNLQDGDILFIDELHRLSRIVEEYLYPAMEDFVLDLMIDSGPNARSVNVKLNRFTLVGATTRMGLISAPMRTRFAFNCRLEHYHHDVLAKIVMRTARLLNMTLDEEGALEIAKRARGTPRIANNLARWVRDYAQQKHSGGRTTRDIVNHALNMLAIDDKGLDEMDKRILELLIDKYNGGPVGISTIGVAIDEDTNTVEEVYEPYLITQGFLKRTPRGREATALAYAHLGRVYNK